MALGAPDVRVSVFNPLGTLILSDVSADLAGGQVMYENTPAGCGAAQLTLGLRYEEAFARGYWTARNIIEISSGDDTLQAAISSSATKIYVTGTQGYDTSVGQDTGQIYLWDGSTLTMRIPVTGVGTDGGGPYITVGSPLGGGSIPAYAQGTVIGRRRYCGRITRRPLTNQLMPNTQITCQGMLNRLGEAFGTFTICSNANVDCGPAMYGCLNQFFSISRFPELTLAGSFATVGCNYAGSASDTSVLSMCQNILNAISTGDQWQLYVGHDRVVRLIKLFTNSGDTYTYNLTLPQGVTYFEPVNVLNTDQDTSSQVNSVKVIGATDPATNQPVNAVEQDSTSITDFGQIDAQPTVNYSVKTVAQAQSLAQSLLDQYSAPQQNGQFRVYTAPNVFTALKNLCPDSELQNTGTMWSTVSGVYFAVGGYQGVNAWVYSGTGAASGYLVAQTAQYVRVTPGETLTISGYIDATHVTGSGPAWGVYSVGLGTGYANAFQTPGVAGRVSATFTVPGGVTRVVVIADTDNCTVANGQLLIWSQPQLEQASSATPYQSSEPPTLRPMGLDAGDIVLGVHNVTITRFDGTGAVANMVPDSAIEYGSGAGALWTLAGPMVVVNSAGPGGCNVFSCVGTGSPSGYNYAASSYIDVVPGQQLTLSGYIDATHATAGNPGWYIFSYPVTYGFASALQTAGVAGRVTATFTVPPDITKISVICDTSNCTISNGQPLYFAQPQLQVGAGTAYVDNFAAPNLFGLVSSAQTTIIPGTQAYQDVYFSAIQPDWGSVIAQRANAQQTAITQDQLQAPGLSQYFVSPGAWPSAGPSTSGLVVTVPAFQAVFAQGTQPLTVGGNTFTCTANATNWAWITSGNTWTVRTDTTFVSGGILYGIFQAGASTILGETPKVTVGNLGQPMSYLLNNVAFTPTFTSISVNQTLANAFNSQITISFSVTNQPTDGSFSKTRLWYRQSGQTSWILLGDQSPNNSSGSAQPINGPFSAIGSYVFKFPDSSNGIAYEFGCSLESSASTETAIIQLGSAITPLPNQAPSTQTVPPSALPAFNSNLVSDSSFQNSPFNGSGIAASSSYWIFNLIDGISFAVAKAAPGGDGSNLLKWNSGASGSANRYGYSRPMSVATGQTYVYSAYWDARNVTGSNLPFVGIYDYSSGSIGSQIAAVTIPAGTNARIQGYWTATGGVTAIVILLHSSAATINSSTSGGLPGCLIGMDPQFELSPASPGYASPYKPTVGVNTDGTQDHATMSNAVQSRISTSSALNVGTGPGSVTGNVPYANNSTAIQAVINSSSQFTLTTLVGLPQNATGLMVAAGGAYGFTAAAFGAFNGGDNILFVRAIVGLTSSSTINSGVFTIWLFAANNTSVSSSNNAYVAQYSTNSSGVLQCAISRFNGGSSATLTLLGGGGPQVPLGFYTTDFQNFTYDHVYNYNGGNPQISVYLNGSLVGTWQDNVGGSVQSSGFCGFQNNSGSPINLDFDIATSTLPHYAHSTAVQSGISTAGSLIGVGGTLHATNIGGASIGVGSHQALPYTLNPALTIDLTALSPTSSYFVQSLIWVGAAFTGSGPLQFVPSVASGSVSGFISPNPIFFGSNNQIYFPPFPLSFTAAGGQSVVIELGITSGTGGDYLSGGLTCTNIQTTATRTA